jgi:hypothetical protein
VPSPPYRGTPAALPRLLTALTPRHSRPRPKPKAKAKRSIYAERRNGGHPRAHKAALTRPCSHLAPPLQTQAKGKVKGKGPRLPGVGSPTPAPQSSKPPASRQMKGDLTAPGRQRQNRPPPAHTPAAAATGASPSPPQAPRGRDHQAQPPARRHRHRKGLPAPEPGPAAPKPRPGTGNQQPESGQSQEPPPGKQDINSYTGMKQTCDSDILGFRIIAVTSLYRHCHGTAQGSRNHLTNVSEITT